MYDATRADVLAAYPQPTDYAAKMAVWTSAIKAAFPAAQVAWVGLANAWDDRTTRWNDEVFPQAVLADAATIHLCGTPTPENWDIVCRPHPPPPPQHTHTSRSRLTPPRRYPGLPPLNLTTPDQYSQLLATLFPLLNEYRAFTDASIPARLRLWATEWGTWSGSAAARFTWLQGLWHAAFSAQLPTALPRLDVLLPYCAVCGDAQMPSFTTSQFGPVVPPNTTVAPGDWRRTASGHAYALLFSVLGAPAATAVQALSFAPNAQLDPATPSSRQLVGLRAVGAGGADVALALVNLGAAAAALDISAAFGGAGCANVWSPANVTDAARAGIRVEELDHVSVSVAAGSGALTLAPYAIGVITPGAC